MSKVTTNSDLRRRVQKSFSLPSRAKQSFKDECDINRIVTNWNKNQLTPFMDRLSKGSYMDLVSVGDYHTSLNQVIAAQEAFNSLPATIRDRFANDPAKFLAFANDPSNSEEMISLGLATPKPAAPPERPPESSDGGAAKEPKAPRVASTKTASEDTPDA